MILPGGPGPQKNLNGMNGAKTVAYKRGFRVSLDHRSPRTPDLAACVSTGATLRRISSPKY